MNIGHLSKYRRLIESVVINSMVNRVDGNHYYEYAKLKNVSVSDTGEKFSLDYKQDELPGEKEKKEKMEEKEDTEEEEEDYDTLNGFLIYKLDRIPQDGETAEISYKGYLFSVLRVENKTIQQIRVTKLEENPEE